MSVIIMARVFWTDFDDVEFINSENKRIKISPVSANAIMLAISDSANDYGENSWNSTATLGKKSKLKPRSVARVCKALRSCGYIQFDGFSKYGTNNFSVCLDKLGEIPKKNSGVLRKKTLGVSGEDDLPMTLVTPASDSESTYPLVNPLLNTNSKSKTNNPHKNKKGDENMANGLDPVDGLLWQLEQVKNNEYLEKVSDYPEQYQKSLTLFLQTWKLSPAIVPSHKNKSGYGRWIKGINSLTEISGEKRFKKVLGKAYETWYNRTEEFRNVVDAPDKILPLFTSVDAGLRQAEQNKKDEFEKLISSVEEPQDFVTLEDMKKSMKNKKDDVK